MIRCYLTQNVDDVYLTQKSEKVSLDEKQNPLYLLTITS